MNIKRAKGIVWGVGLLLGAYWIFRQPDKGVINILLGITEPFIGDSLSLLFWIASFAMSGVYNLYVGFHPRYKPTIFGFLVWIMYTIGTFFATLNSDIIPWISFTGYLMLSLVMCLDSEVHIVFYKMWQGFSLWMKQQRLQRLRGRSHLF